MAARGGLRCLRLRILRGVATMNDFTPIELPAELTDAPVEDFATTVTPIALSDDERRIVVEVFDIIQAQAPDTLLGRVEAAIDADKARPAPAEDHAVLRRQTLRVWSYFARAIEAGAARDVEESQRLFRRAAYGFARLGDSDRVEEIVFQVYNAQAGQLILEQRIPEGIERWTMAKQFLERGSGMGTDHREMLASVDLELLMQRSTLAYMAGNPALSEQLRRQAAEHAERVAAGHDPADPNGRLWRGIAGALRAQADLMVALSSIALYDFDRVIERRASVTARQAAELLTDVSPPQAAMSKFCAELLAVTEDLAAVMVRVLSSTFHQDHGEFQALRARVIAARSVIPAAAGIDSVRLATACDQVDQWLNNLQRFARPTGKDLGIYGGFVACAAFCVLLVVIAVVNRAFSLGASATQIFASCTTLAVLAGFGLAGLKALRGSDSAKTADTPSQ
jgi:hypothetical protein